jgi:SPP1 gp7 family putative phage head morphogenesis protein
MADKRQQLPFNEAIAFFKQKIQLPSAAWTDIWQEQHSLAFVVAGAQQDALVADFYNSIKKAMSEGTGYGAFQKDFADIVKKHGWAHKGDAGWRSKVIYDTNMTQAYNAGRYQQQWDMRELRPYWQYVHTSWNHPRLEHKGWNGLILRADDPWWGTHYPQNGWGCKCKVNSLSRDGAKAAWTDQGKNKPDAAPPMDWEERAVGKNSNQRRTVLTPKGIDPGFAYNPGKAYLEPHTVPPLDGSYTPVLRQSFVSGPWQKTIADIKPTLILKDLAHNELGNPEDRIAEFLDVFGASLDKARVFEDAAGTSLVVSKALFIKGANKEVDLYKWLKNETKSERLTALNLLAMTLSDPDEIWQVWIRDKEDAGLWRLKRKYIKAFDVEGTQEFGLGVFEWGSSGWRGSTIFLPKKSEPFSAKRRYVDKEREGRLAYKK